MQLNDISLTDPSEWTEKGYKLPAFKRSEMRDHTLEHPAWIHFGAGNIFRAFLCADAQKLLDRGLMRTGIIAAEGFDFEIIKKVYRPFDDLSLLVTLKADGALEKTVIASTAESCILDSNDRIEYGHLSDLFCRPSLQLCTFTITEKGYLITPDVVADLERGPAASRSYMGRIAGLLYARYRAGGLPVAMVSLDNCSHNGDRLKEAILFLAQGWQDPGFVNYVSSPSRVSFPWTMIDKITPRPDAAVGQILQRDGIAGLDPLTTSRNTYIAPYVNAEESQYLVIEDSFPNGRPPLEEAGILFADRTTVEKAERMKVCTCLNPLHTALAIFGCLLGYSRISDEMKDPDLVRLVSKLGYDEGLPAVTDPGIINPCGFIDTVIHTRLPNPFIPDTPQRIACDTSQKMSIRFGETIKSYHRSPELHTDDLVAIPLTIAGWLRYLVGLDDSLSPMELSPDPMLPVLQNKLKNIRCCDKISERDLLDCLLSEETLFGADLCAVGLSGKVIRCFEAMLRGPGAVRSTLREYLT